MQKKLTLHIVSFYIILTILISLGVSAITKIHKSIDDVGLKQEKISQQVDELHVVSGHSSIPYKKYVGKFTATFYCPCAKCVGSKKQIRTSTGNIPHPNHTIAVDSNIIPLHSIVYIKDLGFYVAEDTGGAIKGNKVAVISIGWDPGLFSLNRIMSLLV